MLRAAFLLTGALFIPLGLFLYFLPSTFAAVVGISPLWLARVAGGLLLSWGVFQLAASSRPDGAKVGGLAGGNLLTVAAIVPPVLRLGEGMPTALRTLLLGLALLLAVFAVMAMIGYVPSQESRRER